MPLGGLVEGSVRFPLASMDGRLTLIGLPAVVAPGLLFVLASWVPSQTDVLGSLGCLLVAFTASVWLFLRPTQLVVHDRAVTVEFPLRSVEILRRDVVAVDVYDVDEFQARFGGGAWFRLAPLIGGLGWLPTASEPFEAYLTNANVVVAIVRRNQPPILVTPAEPGRFVASMKPTRSELAVSTRR